MRGTLDRPTSSFVTFNLKEYLERVLPADEWEHARHLPVEALSLLYPHYYAYGPNGENVHAAMVCGVTQLAERYTADHDFYIRMFSTRVAYRALPLPFLDSPYLPEGHYGDLVVRGIQKLVSETVLSETIHVNLTTFMLLRPWLVGLITDGFRQEDWNHQQYNIVDDLFSKLVGLAPEAYRYKP